MGSHNGKVPCVSILTFATNQLRSSHECEPVCLTLSLPHQLMIFNASATVLYITAFITCSASVNLTSLKGSRQYNQHAAASVSMAPRAPQAVCRYQDSSHQEPASSPRVSEGGRLLLASLINSKTLGNWDTWGVRKTWG